MQYISTRNKNVKVSSAEAILKGLSGDGGLFVPESIPILSDSDFASLKGMDYIGRAKYLLGRFLTDFTESELDYCCRGAYENSFDGGRPAPLKNIGDGVSIMELWHGPTCAFKDLALQILPYLLTTSSKKMGNKDETVILVATSGDTGKAALEGFCNVEGTKIMVFYPSEGVSRMQKLQMDTQRGDNVFVCSIKGNFDDAQTGVKKIFGDKKLESALKAAGKQFSSANSINWGRLVPQIVYYVSAYLDLGLPERFNVVVPTGNFGNILAAYYAKCMGVPINKLICASNKNKVLTDFINTGVYDKNREFYATESPSMDILISSNLERMLFLLSGQDDAKIKNWQELLFKNGVYTVDDDVKAKMQSIFFGGFCDDEQTAETIGETYKKYGYVCDTHTAVAVNVYNQYKRQSGDSLPVVIASTASPYKFAPAVLSALKQPVLEDDFENLAALNKISGMPVPEQIGRLKNMPRRFKDVIEKEYMPNEVLKFLNIKMPE